MKKFLTIFFVTLGVMFLGVILFGLYFYIADPLNLKPLLNFSEEQGIVEIAPNAEDTNLGSESTELIPESMDKNPILNEAQEKALETFGIDPAVVPSSITPQQEACFIEVLGTARVNEIKAGASPTASEFFKARGCI